MYNLENPTDRSQIQSRSHSTMGHGFTKAVCAFPTLDRFCANHSRHNIEVVDKLNAAGIKGTFFVNGNNCTLFHSSNFFSNKICVDECIYNDGAIASLKKAHASGHLIGSHTWSHSDLTELSWDKSAYHVKLQRFHSAC